MNYLSDKVNSLAGDALSGVNEMRRKLKRQQPQEGSHEPHNSTSAKAAADNSSEQVASSSHRSSEQVTRRPRGTRAPPPPSVGFQPQPQSYYATRMTTRQINSPLAGGTPFGGDSYTTAAGSQPPPPGFRTSSLYPALSITSFSAEAPPPPPGAVVVSEPTASGQQQPQPQPQPQVQIKTSDSSESLYQQADAWARLWFPRVMILCLLRMLLFIRKLYEDFHATKVYNLTGQTGFLLVSATTLFLPTIIFTLYRVSRYLQVVLPSLRLASNSAPQQPLVKKQAPLSGEDESALTRALMTSSPADSMASGPRVTSSLDDEPGLVTARQSPEAPEEPSSQQRRVKLESVNVDKLAPDLPDKETLRVFVGACEQFLHGILFVFWQLKRQVDVMGYLVERACLWRKPAEHEKEELARLRTGSDGLEWFQDFYAAFLAILAQVYMLSAYWHAPTGSSGGNTNQMSAGPLGAATNAALGSSSSEPVSNSARILSSFFGTQAISGQEMASRGKDVLLVSELVVSSAVILSLLICVRRRDDGPLTLGLSMLGWGSLFAARIIIIGLAFVHISWHFMLPLVVLHVLGITGWIYTIALASHNDAPSERLDEAEWDQETAAELAASTSGGASGSEALELETKTRRSPQQPSTSSETSNWSVLEHLVLLTQILALFAIPSLFYWPIMFNLKRHLRVFKYLVLILIQNFLLIPAIWWTISNGHSQVAGASTVPTAGQLYLLGTVGAASVLGFIFVSLYVACKPSLTEYFARADELFNEADQSGIYYEFCSRVFKMPDLSKTTFRRLMNQSEAVIEERYELAEAGEGGTGDNQSK